MKAIFRNSQLAIALSLVAALAILLVAWLVPLPGLELGVEAQSATRMPQTRADVAQAESKFEQSEAAYKTFVATYDIGGDLNKLDSALAAAQANPGDAAVLDSLRAISQPISSYVDDLLDYDSAGQEYFQQVRHYDDELMSWTRSLGANSEALRPDTWPIVEHLKLYPPPAGEKADYTDMAVMDIQPIQAIITSLRRSGVTGDELAQATGVADKVRAAGRSVEYVEGLHAHYLSLLKGYDTKLQAIASGSVDGSVSNGRTLFATGANLLLGLALLAGLAALFIPQLRTKKEAAL